MQYPSTIVQGERYAIPADEPSCPERPIPRDEREDFVASAALKFSGNPPRGRQLVMATRNSTSQVLHLGHPYRSRSRAFLRGPSSPARGRSLRFGVPVGCGTTKGEVTGFEPGHSDDNRPVNTVVTEPFTSRGAARGDALLMRGTGRCPNVAEVLHEDGSRSFEYVTDRSPDEAPYYVDLFGHTCAFCPTVFVTFETPCVGCSYRDEDLQGAPQAFPPVYGAECVDPHRRTWYDWSIGAFVDDGPPQCVQNWGNPTQHPEYTPDWRIGCDIDADSGAVLDHHCEECVYFRHLGMLTNHVMNNVEVLTKVPMRPARSNVGRCRYGCGEFGWELWSEGPEGLHVPHDWLGGEALQSREQPCTCSLGTGDCRQVGNSSACYNTTRLGGLPRMYEGGHAFCGTGLTFDCGNFVFCATTHFFEWDHLHQGNLLKEAWLCVHQHEHCSLPPCPKDPRTDGYNAPSSDAVAWVSCGYVVELVFKHWGPRLGAGGTGAPGGCCDFYFDRSHDTIRVRVKGEFNGPVAWGNLGGGWVGYPFGQGGRPYPGTYPIVPEASYPGTSQSACANMFVDQGSYDDRIAMPQGPGQPGDVMLEPPKRCPSWRADPVAGAQFWCPPHVWTTWEIIGNTSGNWDFDGRVNSKLRPNRRTRGRQCWSGQVMRGGGVNGCADGNRWSDDEFIGGCQDPSCRRGCSFEETLDPGGRVSPHDVPRATPAGCSQCVPEYP